jgi:hypothetical protein
MILMGDPPRPRAPRQQVRPSNLQSRRGDLLRRLLKVERRRAPRLRVA